MDHRVDHGDVVHENSRAIDAHMFEHVFESTVRSGICHENGEHTDNPFRTQSNVFHRSYVSLGIGPEGP